MTVAQVAESEAIYHALIAKAEKLSASIKEDMISLGRINHLIEAIASRTRTPFEACCGHGCSSSVTGCCLGFNPSAIN